MDNAATTAETPYQRKIREANERRDAEIAATRAALAAAMRKAGADPATVYIARGVNQDAYADETGWAITADDAATADRAAAWLHTYLTRRGLEHVSAGFFAGGWSRRESLPAPCESSAADRVLGKAAKAHCRWIRLAWHSIGD